MFAVSVEHVVFAGGVGFAMFVGIVEFAVYAAIGGSDVCETCGTFCVCGEASKLRRLRANVERSIFAEKCGTCGAEKFVA